jgi:hypothetical protein
MIYCELIYFETKCQNKITQGVIPSSKLKGYNKSF